MTGIITLIVPPERFSAIDYFFEQVDKLSINLDEVEGIKITASAYQRMTKDPYLEKTNVTNNELGTFEDWVGEEITIGDTYYPPLFYTLVILDDGSAMVRWIEYTKDSVKKTLVFEAKTDYTIEIDYKAA